MLCDESQVLRIDLAYNNVLNKHLMNENCDELFSLHRVKSFMHVESDCII